MRELLRVVAALSMCWLPIKAEAQPVATQIHPAEVMFKRVEPGQAVEMSCYLTRMLGDAGLCPIPDSFGSFKTGAAISIDFRSLRDLYADDKRAEAVSKCSGDAPRDECRMFVKGTILRTGMAATMTADFFQLQAD